MAPVKKTSFMPHSSQEETREQIETKWATNLSFGITIAVRKPTKVIPFFIGLITVADCHQPQELPNITSKLENDTGQATHHSNFVANAVYLDLTHSAEERVIFCPTEDGIELDRKSAGFAQAGHFTQLIVAVRVPQAVTPRRRHRFLVMPVAIGR